MEIHKAYRFRLNPTPRQLRKIRRVAGCVRYVYNRLLAERKEDYERCKDDTEAMKRHAKEWSVPGMCVRLAQWRKSLEWLKTCSIVALRSAVDALNAAYTRFFKNLAMGIKFEDAGSPQFKRKGKRPDSFRVKDVSSVYAKSDRVRLPKIGFVRFRKSREIVGQLRTLTVRQDGEHWYVSLVCLLGVPEPAKPSGEAVGVDAGIASDYTVSTGEMCSVQTPTKEERKHQAYLARQASKKQKGSNRRKKAYKKLHKFKRYLRDRVHDNLHKLTTRLAKTHGRVSVEKLQVKSMTASAKGTVEQPGKNVKQKAGLNRELLARCFYEFRRQLEYKCRWYGSEYREVEPAYTSQRCHECGHVAAENRETQARFLCVKCGYACNADVNAALNIRDAEPVNDKSKSGGARRTSAGRRRQKSGQGTANLPNL